jgi:uncharacterized protein
MSRSRFLVALQDVPDQGLELNADAADAEFRRILEDLHDRDAGAHPPLGSARLRVELHPERVEVTGRVAAAVPQLCARCGNAYVESIAREFRQDLLRRSLGRVGGEVELHARDLDGSEFVSDELDLRAVLAEELLLALPAKPLCREDCKGLCARCGADLNVEACRCEPEADSRFAILRSFRPGS